VSDPTQPHAVIVAGPNGAGKSTVAPRLLVGAFQVSTFVNADVIAQGLAGFDPASAAIQAGRIMLARLEDLRRERADFAFETTLSGLAHRRTIERLRGDGYKVHLFYLWIPRPELSITRVQTRVSIGGHHISDEDVRRRYRRGIENFRDVYRWLVTDWFIYDGAAPLGERPTLLALGGGDTFSQIHKTGSWTALLEGRRPL
jgi:predicted ABC-type ATPase